MVSLRSLSVGAKSIDTRVRVQQPVKSFQDSERRVLDGIDKWLQSRLLPSYTTAISRPKGLPPKPSEVEECEHLIHVLEEGVFDLETLDLRDQDQMRRELLLSQVTVMVEVLLEHLETLAKGSEEDIVQALKDEGVELPDSVRILPQEDSRSALVEGGPERDISTVRMENTRDLIAAAANKVDSCDGEAINAIPSDMKLVDVDKIIAEHQQYALDSDFDSDNERESEGNFRATTSPLSIAASASSDEIGVQYSPESNSASTIAERDAERKHILALTNSFLEEIRERRKETRPESYFQDTPERELVVMVGSSPKGEAISE